MYSINIFLITSTKKIRTIKSFEKQHRTNKNPFRLVRVSFDVEREFSLFKNTNHI